MKKELNIEEALKVLERGENLECQLSYREDNLEIVSTKERLDYLYNLSSLGIQKCKIFKKTPDEMILSDNDIEMSFDEAYHMLFDGETVFYQDDGEEKEINGVSELIKIKRNFDIRSKKLFLYWHE